MMASPDGYSYLMTLVLSPGRRKIHFRPSVEDVVWMMRPEEDARLRAIHARGEEREYPPVWSQVDDLTACGLAIEGPCPGATITERRYCRACWRMAAETAHPKLEALLKQRWRENWPHLDRAEALVDYVPVAW